MLEQLEQTPTPSNGPAKIEELGRIIAAQQFSATLQRCAQVNANEQPLPSKTFCLRFFELFPSTNRWAEQLRDRTVDDLIRAYDAAAPNNNLAELIDVIAGAIVTGAFNVAFKYLAKPALAIPTEQPKMQTLLATYHQLVGMRKHLQRNLGGAAFSYKEALSVDPTHFEARLLLATVKAEMGHTDEAKVLFANIFEDRIQPNDRESLLFKYLQATNAEESNNSVEETSKYVISACSVEERIALGYCLFHRAESLWITRINTLQSGFKKDFMELASNDLIMVWRIIEGLGDLPGASFVAKRLLLTTLLTIINLKFTIQGIGGIAHTDEDKSMCKICMELANKLDPNNPSVLMLNCDVLAMEEKFEECKPYIEKLMLTADKDDGIPYVMKANLLVHKGTSDLLIARDREDAALYQQAQDDLTQSIAVYNEALEVEPNCVEAMAQASQVKGLMWDFEGSAALATKARSLARTTDELVNLELMLALAVARWGAVMELSKASEPA